jgi:hypothetical protein
MNTEKTDRSSIFASGGEINLALLYQRKEEPIGLNRGLPRPEQRGDASARRKTGCAGARHDRNAFPLPNTGCMTRTAAASIFPRRDGGSNGSNTFELDSPSEPSVTLNFERS